MKRTHLLLVLLAFGTALCNAQNEPPANVPKGRLTLPTVKKLNFKT
ncbi:MAG: hypothetical protein JNJ90_20625 [Saprospiraceae bacterium]|nr:hypothetical protein [Saprospiraceae bacterium]